MASSTSKKTHAKTETRAKNGTTADEKKSRASAAGTDDRSEKQVIVSTHASSRFRLVVTIVAGLYLATLWLEQGLGSTLPGKISPRVWIYFAQVAALFKGAGDFAIDYRAEGWSCADRRWIEIDVRPFFAIDADTKENRFHRAMQFYRKERSVMNALDDYVVRKKNAGAAADPRRGGDGKDKPIIGGVRFLSLRIPYPKLGEHVTRREYQPLADYPQDIRHPWYWTLSSKRRERCGDHSPPLKPDKNEKREKEDDEPSFTPLDGEKDNRDQDKDTRGEGAASKP